MNTQMSMTTPSAQTDKTYEFVLRNGLFFDSLTKTLIPNTDVAISGGKVVGIAKDLDGVGAEEFNCDGKIISPGLIDLHVHIGDGLTRIGLEPLDAAFSRGVIACVDAGSAGASNFRSFRKYVIDPSPFKISLFLNVSVIGLVDIRHGELTDPTALNIEDALAVINENRDVITGLKFRASENVVGGECVPLLEKSLELAEQAGLPLMVHIGHTVESLNEIVTRLRPGDIVTHVYTDNANGIYENGKILESVKEARKRGVLFEVGHGRTQLDYPVARAAIAEGFLPDIISTDISSGNWMGPSFDLATVISKFVALGMSLEDVLESVTVAPAEVIHARTEGYGAVEVGKPAHITILEQLTHEVELPDSKGRQLAVKRLEPVLSLSNGIVTTPVPWRGHSR